MRTDFVLSEIRTGLRRNLTLTIAVILTVALSLALFGVGLVIRYQVKLMKGYWYDKVEVSIFLKADATPAQRDALRSELQPDKTPEVKQVFYESKQEAFAKFKEQFRNQPAIIENTTADTLPESFRVKLNNPRDFDVIATKFRRLPGVEQVLNQRELLKPFFRLIHGLELSTFVIALVALVTAVLLVSNTIRVAAYSRRRETGIMRLVGASNFYIQLPFLLEGAVAGLLGAVLSFGGLAAFKQFIIDGIIAGNIARGITPFIDWGRVWGVLPLLILIGVAITSISSFVTLRRHLRV